jgi:hypothetical protein
MDGVTVEEVPSAAVVGALDQQRVRLVIEQRVEVFGAPVVVAGVGGRLERGDPDVVGRAVAQSRLVALVGRARRDRVVALRAPAALAGGAVGDFVRVAGARRARQCPSG